VSDLDELYDYRDLRSLSEPTMIVARVARATLVLGSAQARDVVDSTTLGATSLRRRRGGGGLVLLRPGDLWVDWWIPRGDERWDPDVHVSSIRAGTWWAEALAPVASEPLVVHRGALEGPAAFRVVCFAGRGPGEVFVGERKIVGVTQWRVREGVFLSSVLHVGATVDVVGYLRHVPDGLADVLEDETLSSLVVDDEAMLTRLREASGPWVQRFVDLAP
jgi:lipoate-protein ligase A